ncbi:BTAD domain-containing putative transcriptional regulator [Mycobacterium sp. NPDC051804]|uniref:BTAD domain-containing putative transcriptional regulator n=1 Tax=Mycobacterium sp. NPDC051804 TaxID=3364295 RepID=UPI00378D6890
MLGLYSGSAVSADMLVELLWGDEPPRTAAKALQTHISALRRTLGDGFVLTEGTGWTVRTSKIDATRYKAAARLARDAIVAGDVGQAVARFDEALSLWRGTPELPDSARGTSEKTRWIEGHDALVEDRADALLATGRAAEIIGELEAAVADAPLRERRWGQLMLALYRAGRQGEALGAFQRARSLLAEELGVDPGPDLRRLEAAIVAQDDALELPVAQQLSAVTRAVTFLLTDIEGSTAAWEADADAMAVALARHDELVEQVVTSRGGRLVKTRGEGDATFSVFDRPSGAAAAAIELQEAIRHEPWALANPMRIRVALHTGEVELRGGDYFGRAVNRAARLRSLALGGQILCSGATAELVIDTLSDDVLLVDLGSRQLKNLARPEHVFELRLEAAESPAAPTTEAPPIERPELPAVLAGTGPFVGRATELERLLSAWESTMEAGARAVLIAGEPGVGKTRLAGEWSRQAFELGAVVIYGRCDEDLGVPYQPFAEALRSLVPCLGADRLRGLRGVESLLSMVPGLTDALPDLVGPARADADSDRYALFDAVVALLAVASASAPVVLILDDLHWAAKPTLLLLRHLLRFGEHTRVQIVGTYRSTDLDRSHPLAAMLADLHRDGTAHRLQLDGLDEDDVTAYVTEAGYDDEELARALAAVTGGNPFFLIEALRHVDESGGRWDPSTLPQGVREAVSRRLSRLPAQTNKALAAAAVVGSRFAVDLVERVVDQDLIDAFDDACTAGIIIEEPGGRYRFNHALVRQSLLAELASVRRMRLHQRIAVTLENEPGADDELLSDLAYHYFECAWAGNAAKAVDYCRRAADQAMTRLAYEGAADLYDRALHALEELDDELPDREDQQAELLVARCEALLAAGDVVSASGAVEQLLQAAGDSARLAAWGACFDGEVSMLTNPERLDEIESAVAAAAEELAGLDDAAGEAKAHTVRALCLGRLGRIADCETALDQALTAARRAGDHRRVNAVLATAPLAALWGPNPVPRAGGRCLDVVRLLRITTGSPVVEATSTRCQGVLDAFRGRAAAGRQLIDSARRSLTELGMRHALLEVEQFAGLVELVADDPVAAEPHLRRAYHGFRRMGLDADSAETAAMLARACLALDRDGEADELCTESERLAGHASKAAIAWRIVRAQLLSRKRAHHEARRVAEEAIALAERTDALVDHGDACLALASVLAAAGNTAEARAAAEHALELYDRKGAAALAEKARGLLVIKQPEPPAKPEGPTVELENACVRVMHQADAAFDRGAWDECEQFFAPDVLVESRRKVVGFMPGDLRRGDWPQVARHLREGWSWHRATVIALRGERLALARIELGTDDPSLGAPHEEFLGLWGLDEDGRIALQVFFDIDDTEAAVAELDARHRAIESEPGEPDTACVRVARRLDAAYDRNAWDELEQHISPVIFCESRRKVVRFGPLEWTRSEWLAEAKHYRETLAEVRYRHVILAVRGERLALTSFSVGPTDETPGAPRDELVQLYGLDEEGRLALQMWFDVEDMDAAIAELDAAYTRLEGRVPPPTLENAASRVDKRFQECFIAQDWDALTSMLSSGTVAEDRRRVVNAGSLDRRDFELTVRAYAAVESQTLTSTVIATRGQRLAMSHHRFSGRDHRPDAFSTEMLVVIEIDADERMAAIVTFDLDEFDAAIEELDARYIAGEAAEYEQTWSKVAEAYARLNRRELPATTRGWFNTDHRRLAPVEAGQLAAFVRDAQDQWGVIYIERVHRLSDLGAVVSRAIDATSHDGFDAEWREIDLLTFEGNRISRLELFDASDLEGAIAKFDSLSQPAHNIENRASRVGDRYFTHFADRDWDALAGVVAEDILNDDRRSVVNTGIRCGRDNDVENMRTAADLGFVHITSDVLATRGERLVLARVSGHDGGRETFVNSMLAVVEIDSDDRIAVIITFDLSDLDAATTELDARYLAGEAALHGHAWSVAAGVFAALNRHELPAATPEWVSIDHRRGTPLAETDLKGLVTNLNELTPDLTNYIEVVHLLRDHGAVITQVSRGTSPEGFDAEWRMVNLLTIDGDAVNRCELFDEDDVDVAVARLDALVRPETKLDNLANRVVEQYLSHFATRSWDVMAQAVGDDFTGDDRRRVVNGGVRHGRESEIASLKAMAEIGCSNITSTPLAVRGKRLVLARHTFDAPDWPELDVETVDVVEVNDDGQIVAEIAFDADDLDAASAELDARYLAGEAASNATTWSVVTRAYTEANNKKQLMLSPDAVTVDHRRGRAFSPGEMAEYMYATWNLAPDVCAYIEVVHRLSQFGTVVTHVARGASQQGFEAEWRELILATVDADLIDRCEMFDEADLDAALARFDELSRPARQLENDAVRVGDRLRALFEARDWTALAELYADDVAGDDRRRVIGGGARSGKDTEIVNMRAMAELNAPRIHATVLAVRGQRLALFQDFVMDDEELVEASFLGVFEINADNRIVGVVGFDDEDIDAAYEELDKRYLAGEAAANPHVWSVVSGAYAAVNRHELPPWTADAVSIDHRSAIALSPGDLASYIHAMWGQTPNVRVDVVAVHRLTRFGALVTHVATGTTEQGFEGEWREITLSIVEGDRITRSEMFDEADLDAALAKFDELNRPKQLFENAASRIYDSVQEYNAERNWDAVASLLAEDLLVDDRRPMMGAGIRHGRDAAISDMRTTAELGLTHVTSDILAIRGERLLLVRSHYFRSDDESDDFVNEVISLYELNADDQVAVSVIFNPDEIDIAIEELETRYLAGEGAAYAHTWASITRNVAAFNRGERSTTTPDWITIDHRSVTRFAPGELSAAVNESADPTTEFRARNIAVHRLCARGAVVTTVSQGTSPQGFEAEWKVIQILTVDGDFINRCELFDETDLDAALVRFDEIAQPAERLDNTASRVEARAQACIAAGDWDALTGVLAGDVSIDDRRRVVNAGLRRGRDAVVEDLRVGAEIGLTQITPTAIATRGENLTLRRIRYSGGEQRPEVGVIDLVQIVEIDAEEQIVVLVLFDADDLERALAELDARYIAGEAAAHARTWSQIKDDCDALNQQQLPTRPDFVFVDRRRVASIGAADVEEFFQAAWELTPDMTTFVESVHRLSDVGAVVSQVAHGTSRDGFYAEWRVINLYKVDGDHLSRCEVFDETDIDAALARFDELTPARSLLANTASRVADRFWSRYEVRDWDSMKETLCDDVATDDRRSVVRFDAEQQGVDAVVQIMRAAPDVGIPQVTQTVIATRGERLALVHTRFSGREPQTEPFYSELLYVFEVNSDNKIAAFVLMDVDAVDAAREELDKRYLTGDAAPHAHTFSLIAEAFAAVNRRELPTTAAEFVSLDHRRPVAFAPGEMMVFLQATFNDAPEIRIDIDTVHRLSNCGAVVSHTLRNTSPQGFDAEWRVIGVSMVEGGVINRCELFDEADLDAALTRFGELSHPVRMLENAASQVVQRFNSCFAERDWPAMAEILADNIFDDDRRRVVNAGTLRGRADVIGDVSALANIGARNITSELIATRGARLVLNRARYSGREERPESFHIDALDIVGVNAENQIVTHIAFDPDDIDAAFAELDARYLADEAAPYADTWTVITQAYAALNRHELPPAVSDLVHDDHHRLPLWKGDLAANMRAAWEGMPDWHIQIVAVHRLTDVGVVVTCIADGKSQQGFGAEVSGIAMLTVQGGQINRFEYFDDADLDTAMARFEELSRPMPRLGNAASRVYERRNAYFAARDWAALAETLADDVFSDDRRRVVNTGATRGRDAQMANNRAAADVGVTTITSTVLATRGERLALSQSRISGRDRGPEAFQLELLGVVEIDADERMVAYIAFEVDDLGAALAELDARYLAGEAAVHSRTWSVIKDGYAALNRHEIPPTTPNWVNVDHRRGGSAFASGEMATYIRSSWEDSPQNKIHVETVHRLNDLGAVVTTTTRGVSVTGFYAEWREVGLVTVDGEKLDRTELFDESDLDAALTKFDELSRPARVLENAAGRIVKRARSYFAVGDWDGMRATLAEDFTLDDRRRTVNGGMRHGGGSMISDARIAADVGLTGVAYEVMAVRGMRLILTRTRYSEKEGDTEAFFGEVLEVIEIDDAGKVSNIVTFDPDDIDAAFAELDARYAAGEAAPYAHTWNVIADTHSAYNRDGSVPNENWTGIDHRKGYPAEKLSETIRIARDLTPDFSIYIECVHRLSDRGAVIANKSFATGEKGFAAEWRMIQLMTVDGDRVLRLEIFDEDDLDAALARFDELSRPAQQLRNTASEVNQRLWSLYETHEWDAIAGLLAEDIVTEDRRAVVNAGIQHGRDVELVNMRTLAEIGAKVTSTAIATRGQRLVLTLVCTRNRDLQRGELSAEMLDMIEVDKDHQIVRGVLFETEDIDAAFAELDTRYLAGEAATHSQTWTAVTQIFDAIGRRELPATSQDWVHVDHRPAAALETNDSTTFLSAVLEQFSSLSIRIEAVHRLTELGAVITHSSHGTSKDGFDAEWRMIDLLTVERGLVKRGEVFDDTDLDAALAKFDALNLPPRRLENAATRAESRCQKSFAMRDWDAMATMMAPNLVGDDRRRDLASGVRHGREAEIENLRAWAGVGIEQMTSETMAIRGEHLVLSRTRLSGRNYGPDGFHTDLLRIVETNADERIVARVVFDPDDVDAAFAELDARYAADEAAPHAQTWSVLAPIPAAFNRRELPATTPDCINIDHRRGTAFSPGELTAYVRATWDMSPEAHVNIESVQRLSGFGAVVTHAAHAVSQDGFAAEWRVVNLYGVTGDRISRCEIFDEDELDAALARFDELSRPSPALENSASRVATRFRASFAARDWDAMAKMLAGDLYNEDRRPVVNAGIRHGRDSMLEDMRSAADIGVPELLSTDIATRGERLVLVRAQAPYGVRPEAFYVDNLAIAEIDGDGLVTAQVVFGVDEFAAALVELDARYAAGEASAHSHTWSAIAEAYAAFNRREMPQTTPDWVSIDHRRAGRAFAPGDQTSYIQATWEVAPRVHSFASTVHRLNDLGAVVTQVTSGTSHQGFDVEWQDIVILTVDGALLSRCEVFDEADLDTALATFDELTAPPTRVENAATRIWERLADAFNSRDVETYLDLTAPDGHFVDRRKGLRDSHEGVMRRRVIETLFEYPRLWRMSVEHIAVRGSRMCLSRQTFRDHGDVARPITVEVLAVTDSAGGDVVYDFALFDPDDIDAAFEELESRYVAGEAAVHAGAWSVIASTYGAFNRRELLPTRMARVHVDHRSLDTLGPSNLAESVRASWNLVPDIVLYVEIVHRLSSFGALVTIRSHGTSHDGFDAEWRMIQILMIEGDRVDRLEIFGETDLDAAITRFDELSVSAPQLANAATQNFALIADAFNRRDLKAFLDAVSADARYEDRRKGLRNEGRVDANLVHAMLSEAADGWRLTIDPIAVRGHRLALSRYTYRDANEAECPVELEALVLTEVTDDQLADLSIVFDPDDIDSAFAELDTQYGAGEGAAQAHTWALIVQNYATFNRHEMPAQTPDWTNIDHRRATAFAPGDLTEYIHAAWSVTPDTKAYVQRVHRLDSHGAVLTALTYGTSPQGFHAEWQDIHLATFEGDLCNRFELFDETALNAALSRYDELTSATTQLENAATRNTALIVDAFNRRDLDGVLSAWDMNARYDDRRKGLRDAGQMDRDYATHLLFDAPTSWQMEFEPIAIRGRHLALTRLIWRDTAEADRAVTVEMSSVVAVADSELLYHATLFDPNDVDAAFAELDTRWIALGEVEHPDVIRATSRLFEATNRHDWEALAAIQAGAKYINHRQLATGEDIGDHWFSLRTMASLIPDMRVLVAEIPASSARGVVTDIVVTGTTAEGTAIELPAVIVLLFDGDRLTHMEAFDSDRRPQALARFQALDS